MTFKAKVQKVAGALGIVIPQEVLEALKIGEGAILNLKIAPPEEPRIAMSDSTEKTPLKIAEEGMRRYGNALKELAKSDELGLGPLSVEDRGDDC